MITKLQYRVKRTCIQKHCPSSTFSRQQHILFMRPSSQEVKVCIDMETWGIDTYRTWRHRTLVYEQLPSQLGLGIVNSLPDPITNSPTPKVLRSSLKNFLSTHAFYSVEEFLGFNWIPEKCVTESTHWKRNWKWNGNWVYSVMYMFGCIVWMENVNDNIQRKFEDCDALYYVNI